ncbi:GAF and ANTAR domain-containing protein [Streptomyces sp. cg28]|uniref:GAF and ANTAR domain-containing protein n=1 Tax=Streptomyces sp. cg28 TaxID=3403457 RepID=UPI003B216322
MEPRGGTPESAAAAWRRAARARDRADREYALADELGRRAATTGNPMHQRLTELHRTTAVRHRVAADILEAHARRASRWTRYGGPPPVFMTGVAEACGSRSVAVTLVDGNHHQLASASSDQPARQAQDLEYTLGEGPALDAVQKGIPIDVSGSSDLGIRWPGYGPALVALGIGQVIAVPLQVPGNCIGALAVFDPPKGPLFTRLFTQIADALTCSVFLGHDADPGLYGGIDYRVEVHQAAGMVAVQAECRIADALELVKARAFAEGRPIGDVARDIVHGQLKLG